MKSAILRAAVLVTAMIGMLGFAMLPAQAAVTSSVYAVNQCDSSGGSCSAAIKTDGTGLAHGIIQITAKESAGLLDPAPTWVRVVARNNTSGTFVCLASWNTTSKTFSGSTKWDTSSIPSQGPGCPSGGAGGLTNNGTLQLQVQTHNSNGQVNSSIVTIKLNNAPTPPAWAASPSVSGASARAPVVTLKWNASPEPDIQEYRFFRTDPSGTTKQYPVSASNPSVQGCSFDGTTYTCYDTDFSSTGFGGNYSYTIAAWRSSPSPADTCYIQQTPCIGAQSSDVRQVAITEPAAPSPNPTGGTGGTGGSGGGTGGGSGGTGGGLVSVPSGVPSISTRDTQSQQRTNVLGQTVSPGDCFTCGTYKERLPYGQLPSDGQSGSLPGNQQRPVLAAGSGVDTGSSGPDPRQLWVSIAAGLVLLLTAGHVARVLRATAH